MRKFTPVVIAALWSSVGTANADLLWDNYLSEPDRYDHITANSSERVTLVSDSWTAEDAIFSAEDFPAGVVIEEIRWIGARAPDFEYPTADLIILDDEFNVISEFLDLAYEATVIGSDFPVASETYEGVVNLAALEGPVTLPPGHYYIATRLTGNSLGRNFVMSTGEGVMAGETFAAFQSHFFGVPEWTLITDLPQGDITEFAYQIFGTAVPEPAGIILLSVGGLFLARRR